MTPEELQEVVAAVIAALKTNGKTIDQLTAVTSLADTDNLEISNGKKVSFGKLKELVASSVVITEESIKGWVPIESTSDLPANPTPEEQEKAYILDTMLYVYVGSGGDTLSGKYQSVDLQGPQGATGPAGADGHDGVDLGEVALVNNLTEGGEGSALSAEMGKVLNNKAALASGNKITFGGAIYTIVDISGYTVNHMVRKYDNGVLSTKTDNNATCIFVPVTAGEQYEITATARANTPVAFAYTKANYGATVADILIDATTGTITQVVTIPEGKTYLQLQYANGTCTLRKKTGDDLATYKDSYIDALVVPDVMWYVPSTIYAIVGSEKSIYLNNISNCNDYANWFSVDIACSVGRVDTRRWYYTPTTTSDITLTLKAFDYLNNLVSSKVVTIKVLSAELPSTAKNLVCVGDSITQICNMPATIKSLFSTFTGTQPSFVGNAGDSTCHHEAYYGRSYNWLVTNSESPFVYNNAVDIPHWLNGLGISQIDVVSLAMGINDAVSDWATTDGVARMKTLINAFKAQNANTKFIVHLINFPAMGYVDTPSDFNAQAKRQFEQEFRQLLLDEYDAGTDSNIILGDLGLVYDRFYAHIRNDGHPASYYTDDINKVVDILHPNAQGSEQMGYGIAPSILKMLQD